MSQDDDLREILDRLPLKKGERDVYLALITRGPLGASEISKHTRIDRYIVYTMLNRLNDKGYVDVPAKRRASKYKAVPLTEVITKRQSDIQKTYENDQKDRQIEYENKQKELKEINNLISKLNSKQKLKLEEETLVGAKPSDLVWLLNSEARIKKAIFELIDRSENSIIACLPTLETPSYRQTRQDILSELQTLMKKKKMSLTLIWELEEGTADEEIANDLVKHGTNIYQWGPRGLEELPFAAFLIDDSEGFIILQTSSLSSPKFGLALWIRHPSFVGPFKSLIEWLIGRAYKKW